MSSFTAIDLEKLPPPLIVEALDYEVILAAMREDLLARDPTLTAVALESEPITKLLEVCAYRETVIRQRVNDGARAVMLAYAVGADLDNLAAFYGVARQIVTPEDLTTQPPTPAVLETDSRFRQRITLSLEGFSTAGPIGSYAFYALSADVGVKDVDIFSPNPGEVEVTVLSALGDGLPDQALLDTVEAALNDEFVRPVADHVTVKSAFIINYAVTATLTFYSGPDPVLIRQTAEDALLAYIEAHHRLGHDITLSGLYAALHQPGVQNVSIAEPTETVVVAHQEAAFCTLQTVNAGGLDE